ncbi:hypothetical protein DD753_30395 [Escherichia coli]|nr:hypothetical protein C1I39_30305 [Escherichia coli]PNB85959.1 hypothetical protein C1I42_30290 [Escherichia coli]PWH34562.1 hypothetical protein DD753_30395 [Escherichia coli]
MLPSETMIWQPEFTDKTLSRKPGAVHCGSRFALCPNHSQNFYTHFSLNFPWQFIPAGQL